jgi:hypothetical protein
MSDIRTAIRTEAVNLYGITDLATYLDRAMQSDSSIANSTLRAITQADIPCPVTPTCAGIVDASFQCGTGIESLVNWVSTTCCPVTVQVYKQEPMAVAMPANKIFGDTSNDLKGGICITLNPTYIYARYLIDSQICDNACGGGRGVSGLSGMANRMIVKAILNGTRKRVFDTVNGLATVIPSSTGALDRRLMDLYNSVADFNQGQEIVVMANRSVINRLMQLVDDNGQYIYTDKNQCPITGCLDICFYGVRVMEVSSNIMPNTAGGQADMIAVVKDLLFGSRSQTVVKSKAWDVTLTDTNDILMAQSCVDVEIPQGVDFVNLIAKTTVTL